MVTNDLIRGSHIDRYLSQTSWCDERGADERVRVLYLAH